MKAAGQERGARRGRAAGTASTKVRRPAEGSTGCSSLKTLHTPRLRLEPLEEAHAIALFTGLRNEALYEFISERAPQSVEALAARYRRLSTRVSPDGRESWLNWVLCSLPAGSYVGWVQATVHSDCSAHVAYLLFHEAWGQGLAREAVAAMIDHLHEGWGVKTVRATVDTRNRRSIALLVALGFVRGALRRNAEVIRGAPSDEVEYWRSIGSVTNAR